jgi:hypothetical protein
VTVVKTNVPAVSFCGGKKVEGIGVYRQGRRRKWSGKKRVAVLACSQ